MGEFIQSFLQWLADLGYLGIALGLMVEVIPSEIVLAYGGYLVSRGEVTFVGAVIAGTIGGVLAQLFLYWAGYYGGRPFLEKYGKYILINKKHLDVAEEWFQRYGAGVIFGARFIPVVRHAISIPAGIAKMSWIKFTAYTTAAIIPWSIFFIYIGWELGDRWEDFKEIAEPYVQPLAIVAVILLVGYVLIQSMKRKRAQNNG
ncbi:DedA family protein [Polycladomyces sp. WAk]|uniref:DedA family protein n=1 Tax=Polycladomyces zharkentensis TaxID=2807616 RepID=A0ABS2WLN9_9BACL|nr:DedA family protein [Polycladomyces sp. WAk]MBN2910426.1 DedA family protein [Polycladomyces sp. WAk]